MENKENELDETLDEINSALKDSKGIVAHQKRLAFCLSIGIIELLEKYLTNKNVLKKGYKLNHQWFKKKKENVKLILSDKITAPIESLDKIDKILDAAYKIENKRNELAYGNYTSENILKDLIEVFLEIKKEVEND